MLVTSLEARNCPTSLVTVSGDFVAGLDPFPGYGGPVEFVAHGDVIAVTADKIPHVKVYEAGVEVASFYAYDPRFDGGINLATNGERVATGTDLGAPHVREFTLHGVEVASFYRGDPQSLRGVRVSYAGEAVGPVSVRPDSPVQVYLDGASPNVVRGVAEIFAPFGVGVTNEYPSQADPRRIATVIFGGSSGGVERGQAVVGGFYQQSEFVSYPARVYSDRLTETQQVLAAAHEVAHLFGAVHVADPKSVMFAELLGGRSFDPLNFRVLSRLTRLTSV